MPQVQPSIAAALQLESSDVQVTMSNQQEQHEQEDSRLVLAVTVRVSDCSDASCGVAVGEALDRLHDELEAALDLEWISVGRDESESTRVLDSRGDVIPLETLVVANSNDREENDSNGNTAGSVDKDTFERDSKDDNGDDETTFLASNDNNMTSGAIAGIAVGVLAACWILVAATYKAAYAKGAKDTLASLETEKESDKEGPQMVDERIS